MQASKPVAQPPTPADPNQTLVWIEGRLSGIYSGSFHRYEQQQQLDREEYLRIYNAVTSFCRAVRREGGELRLYCSLERAIRVHCQDALLSITGQSSGSDGNGIDAIVSTYLKQWTAFLDTSKLVRHLFAQLEKSIYRPIDAKVDGVYLLPELHMTVWREEILGIKKDAEGEKIILQVVKEMQHEHSDHARLEQISASFTELGVKISGDRFQRMVDS